MGCIDELKTLSVQMCSVVVIIIIMVIFKNYDYDNQQSYIRNSDYPYSHQDL